MTRLIAPSLLAANFADLRHDVEMINKSDADWLHLDIMDGVFVPNISFGMPVIKAVKKVSEKPLDVHLMIIDPDKYISEFKEAGAEVLTVHAEACRHLNRTVQNIKELNMKAGVSLNPHTPVSAIEEVLPYIDLILIMSVNPGFGGQKFIPSSIEKIRKTRQMIDREGFPVLIEVDGGIDLSNADLLFEAGANVLVTGTTVFHAEDPAGMIRQLKKAGL